jgi:2-methylisocitrate lyase-like PEP mutase family enzyme
MKSIEDMETSQQGKAQVFRSMHVGPTILVLPNAWDAASARIFEKAGFAAVATTSAGIANSLGYPDGQRVPLDEMLDVVERIARAVNVPVTADMEAGYGSTDEAIAKTVKGVIRPRAIGINLEDGITDSETPLCDPDVHIRKIGIARQVAQSLNIPIVINARTDGFLLKVGNPQSRLRETILRANAYLEAGADCIFVPGLGEASTIATLVRKVSGPINILAGRGVPSIAELHELGVARVSVGSGIARAALATVRRAADELSSLGTYSFTEKALDYDQLNDLFRRSGMSAVT